MQKNHAIRKCSGFTLVEAMIVVLVIGILATIAVGGYKKYIAKSLVIQAINASLPLQGVIQNFYQDQGMLPGATDLSSYAALAGYSLVSGYYQISNPIPDVATISWYNAVNTCAQNTVGCDNTGSSDARQIQITFSNPTSVGTTYLAGVTIMLVANLSNGGVSWLCMAYPNSAQMSADGVTLLSTFLPAGCHTASLDH
jgi:prepilin-type N-terminal cleavage/methylation domain-containing protein